MENLQAMYPEYYMDGGVSVAGAIEEQEQSEHEPASEN